MKKVTGPDWASEVKALRNGLGLTQDEFAVKLGKSGSTIGYWESGEVTPHKRTREIVRAACAALGKQTAPASRRYSEETISVLHQALDIILDNADSEVVRKVTADLTKFAGQWGIPSERGAVQRVLDKSGIISGVIASPPTRAAELGKEAQERVHPQQKKKQSSPSKIA